MTHKLTRITPVINGYAVVVVQEPDTDDQAGAYLGCFVQTPQSPDDGPLMLLPQALNAYRQLVSVATNRVADEKARPVTFDRVTEC